MRDCLTGCKPHKSRHRTRKKTSYSSVCARSRFFPCILTKNHRPQAGTKKVPLTLEIRSHSRQCWTLCTWKKRSRTLWALRRGPGKSCVCYPGSKHNNKVSNFKFSGTRPTSDHCCLFPIVECSAERIDGLISWSNWNCARNRITTKTKGGGRAKKYYPPVHYQLMSCHGAVSTGELTDSFGISIGNKGKRRVEVLHKYTLEVHLSAFEWYHHDHICGPGRKWYLSYSSLSE